MHPSALLLPPRSTKPRRRGLTILIDNGVPARYFEDAIESASSYVDLVKFGWGTSVVSDHLERKIASLQRYGVDYCFGGTLFEKFYSQRKVEEFVAYCRRFSCRFVEISNGTIQLSNADKARVISELSEEFQVLSEVGYKDTEASQLLSPSAWIDFIREDLNAGAFKTITEARESGTSGICRSDGELRYGLIEDIIRSGINMDDIVFEAPNKTLQAYFIRRLGTNVNLANIAVADIIGVETLRLGLRSDTLLAFDEPSARNRSGGRYA